MVDSVSRSEDSSARRRDCLAMDSRAPDFEPEIPASRWYEYPAVQVGEGAGSFGLVERRMARCKL